MGEQAAPALTFRADHAVLSPGQVQLDGRVVVAAKRWQLRADRLRLSTLAPDHYEAQGPLVVRPCPCADPPLTLSVQAAELRLADGSLDQLTVRQATVRLAGLPVLYLPWWQLRSERRWGLLPPRAALRAGDGWLLGAGVHAPFAGGLDLEPALYLRGGHELLARLRLDDGELRLRWDRRGSDLVAAQGQALTPLSGGSLSWATDARRGPRARRATIDLEDAARAYDRARVALVLPWAGSFSTGLRASALRGQGDVVVGPQTTWAGSSPHGAAAWTLDALVLARDALGPSSVVRAALDVQPVGWWGFLRVRPQLRTLGGVVAGGAGARLEGAGLLGARLDTPLVRPQGQGQQRLEPGVWLGALASHGSVHPWLIPPLPQGARALATSRLGWSWSEQDSSLSAEASVGAMGARAQPFGQARLGAERGDTRLGLHGSATDTGAVASVVASAAPGPLRLGARLEGQHGDPPLVARLLEAGTPWQGGWYDQTGWSAEASAEVALGRGITVRGQGWWWLSERRWLGERMDLLYRHPCGCLSAGLHLAHRQGREGTDLWFSLGLS